MTQWSLQQTAALDAGRRWLDASAGSVPQVFRIFGGAGTGKTTLAHELSTHVGGRALAAAFTGKAASVMAKKGLPGATTLHRLIYTPTGNDTKKLDALKEELKTLEAAKPSEAIEKRLESVRRAVKEAEEAAHQPNFILKEESDLSSAPLLILDEISQIDTRMAEDLLSFGTRVLVLGDPYQLPPIRGTGYFNADTPEVLLTEIHRQAAGSAILRLATDVREGRPLKYGNYGDARVVERVTAKEALGMTQVLCGTNARRRAINQRHRHLRGTDKSLMPVTGEKLMCLRNDHDAGLMNGSQWITTQDAEWDGDPDGSVYLRIRPEEGGEEIGLGAEARLFLDDSAKLGWGGTNQHFTFSDCCTVHKFQGSESPKVLFFLDDWPRRSDIWTRLAYTGITRASEELTVVL